jgi:hypothetical protein
VEPVITSGLPDPQNVVVEGAVSVFPAMTGVTVTLCVVVSVEVQLTGDIFNALTLITAEELSVLEVNKMFPPVPNLEAPVVAAPI